MKTPLGQLIKKAKQGNLNDLKSKLICIYCCGYREAIDCYDKIIEDYKNKRHYDDYYYYGTLNSKGLSVAALGSRHNKNRKTIQQRQ